MAENRKSSQERVWQIVKAIPPGQVATYGQVARLAGMPSHARLVGNILGRLPPGTALPWHRVVNGQGKVTNPNRAEQHQRLQAEGITPVQGRVNLNHYGWRP